jgi:phage shock protein PspC (stress-responsive transcriptional regulator)
MLRSFGDRVLGGVAGGLAAATPLGAWGVRAVWAVLAVASLGVMLVPYVLLWWLVPLESPVARRQRRFPVILTVLVIAAGAAVWAAQRAGVFTAAGGGDVTPVVLAVVVAFVFLVRQFGGRQPGGRQAGRRAGPEHTAGA